MGNYSEIESKTKKIYIQQHKNYLKDISIFERHRKAAEDLQTYDLSADFFKGAVILDAGCGNTGHFQVAMYNLGASHVACLDIGDEWIPEMKRVLEFHNIPEGFCSFMPGSTLEIPASDETFDLVCSNGVLMHLESPEKAGLAIKELVRCCRRGGGMRAHWNRQTWHC
jgi:2-polyprenyl-3-methyl-5-hydroxy-6-metoxy-1,4-benzoquinol methylase